MDVRWIHSGTAKVDKALLGISLFLALAGLYYLSPVVELTDSRYTMLVSEHLLLRGNLAVDEHFWPYVESRYYPRVRPGRTRPRHIREYGGHLYYYYPAGTAVLSVPFVFLMRVLLGESTIGAAGNYRFWVERIWQKRLAALLAALTCLVLYRTALLVLSARASLLIALGAGLSSQLWSIASRTLQSHTWLILELSLALFLLLRWRAGGRALRPAVLGTLLSLAFFTRPTAACIILPISLYILIRDRRNGLWVIATGAVWCTLLVFQSYSAYGTPMPPYYMMGTGLSPGNLAVGLAAQLVSPSRGLFVFVPLVVLVLYLVFRNWRFVPHPDLATAMLAGITVHSLSMAMFGNWWSGNSYGPRFSTDLIPLYVLLGIEGYAAAKARRAASGEKTRPYALGRGGTLCFVALLAAGALFNGAGALSLRGKRWSRISESMAANPARAFDWKQPQFLCALFASRCPGARRPPP